MPLDSQDWRLLRLLQQDCRMSNAELAEKAGMSASSCWRKVRTCDETGLISRYGALLDARTVGLEFQDIVHVQLTRHSRQHPDWFLTTIHACA